MKNVKVGILGFGTVGYGVYRIITEDNEIIQRKDDVNLEVAKVLVKTMDEANVNMLLNFAQLILTKLSAVMLILSLNVLVAQNLLLILF